MINLLLGVPGGGKSYEAVVFHVLPALANGRKVITNLPLILEEIGNLDPTYLPLIEIRHQTLAKPVEIDWVDAERKYKRFGLAARQQDKFNVSAFSHVEDYGDKWRHPDNGAGPLYIIDECHIPLPRAGTPVEVEEWFSLHRHESADVLLLTQSYGKINAAIRDLVQVVYKVRKATALGSQTKYTRHVQDGLRGAVVNTSIRSYKPQYFKLYKSHTRGGGAELAANDIRPFWRHWTIYGTGAALALGAYLFFTSGPLIPEPTKLKPPQAQQSQAQQPQQQAMLPPQGQDTRKDPGHQIVVSMGGPLDGYGIHVLGYLEMGKRWRYAVGISQNGQLLKTTNSDELQAMGYGVERNSELTFRLTYKDSSRWVMADAPQISVMTGAGVSGGASRASGGVPDTSGHDRSPTINVINDQTPNRKKT